jgi:hypothetical protein
MYFDAYKVLYFQPITYTILMWSFLQVEANWSLQSEELLGLIVSTSCSKIWTVSILQTIFFIRYVTWVTWCKLWEVTATLWPHKDNLWIDPLYISLGLLCLALRHTSLYSLHSSNSILMDAGSNHPVIIFSSNKCFKIINMNQTEMEGNKTTGREEKNLEHRHTCNFFPWPH